MTKDEVLARLQDLQLENSKLHSKLSLLKENGASPELPVDAVRQASIDQEIRELKERIGMEEQETVELRRELTRLINEQEDLQLKIQEDNALIATKLLAELGNEESQTAEFYRSVLNHCHGIPKNEYELLSRLMDVVQKKRKVVAEEIEQNQKVMRLIRFQGGKVPSDPFPGVVSGHSLASCPEREIELLAEGPSFFENPLPCLGEAMLPKKIRKRITFTHTP
jgi:hypothetical protein